MSLTAKDVAEITRLLENSAFDELCLESDGWKLTLRRGGASVSETAAPPSATAAPVLASPVSTAGAASGPAAAAGANGAHPVTAPMLGTFYRAPKPGAPPFVEAGSAVEPDSIVGIIEVMKLMNTVRAGASGTVLEIIAQDGALVEYGEILLRLARAA